MWKNRTSPPYRLLAGAAIVTLLIAGVVEPAAAQDTTRTSESRRVGLSADLATREIVDGQPVRRLIGNVRLREDETILHADRATEYERRDQVLFEGNVLIFERGDTLRAKTVLYNRSTKVGRARGNVRLTDGEVHVTAPSATYFTSEKRTLFTEGVTLVDSVSVLTSETGVYWSDEKRAEFAGSVVLDGTDTDVRADSVIYLRETEVSFASGNVYVESFETDEDDPVRADTTSRTIVVGNWAYTDDPGGIRRIRDDVLLFQVRSDSVDTDTLLIRSEALESTEADSVELLSATGDVRIWTDETSAVSDSVSYRTIDGPVHREVIELFGDPMAWFGSSQVTGDSLNIRSTDGSIDTLRVRNNTLVADRDSTLGRIHQVSGRHLLGLFMEGGRRDMIVGPNAEAIYYLERDGAPDGAVRTSADRIVFELQDDDMKRIRVEDGVEGTYYPEDLMPADLQLSGFRWEPERRPDGQAMVSDPRLSRRDAPLATRPQSPPAASQEARPIAVVRPEKQDRPEPVAEDLAGGEDQEASEVTVELHTPTETEAGAWAPGAVDATAGGYTIVVASRTSISEAMDLAQATASDLADADVGVDVLKAVVSGRLTFRVSVGQFADAGDARRTVRRLGGRIPADSWILAITPDM